jgi:hypothetical protein
MDKNGRTLQSALEDVPAFIEIIYPFELADETVLKNIASTVMHCRREYAGEIFDRAHIA